jgi:hypothetical protein
MALSKDGLYWIVSDIIINRKMNVAHVTIKGYESKEDSDDHKIQKQNKSVSLQGIYYPFVTGLVDIDQISNVYIQLKNKDDYFKDAIDV